MGLRRHLVPHLRVVLTLRGREEGGDVRRVVSRGGGGGGGGGARS